MEFNVSEEVEWECRRIAAAFGVPEWTEDFDDERCRKFEGNVNGLVVIWSYWVEVEQEGLSSVMVTTNNVNGDMCQILFDGDGTTDVFLFDDFNDGSVAELMARGLYRLGFEEEGVSAELNSPLSMHEKLELRLSMPREFWPHKWLDEESQKL